MVNAIRQSARLSVKSRHISDNCTKATLSVCAACVTHTSVHVFQASVGLSLESF